MNVDLNYLIAVIGFFISITSFFIGRQLNAKQLGINDGLLKADVDYIKTRTDEVLIEQKSLVKEAIELGKKLIEVEYSTKQAHKRLDEFSIQLRKDENF